MNALQHLWDVLGGLLPPQTVAELRAQYTIDAQRDQRASAYRKHERWYRAALAANQDARRIVWLEQWLTEHKDWRPQ